MLVKRCSFSSRVHLSVCYSILNNVPNYEATMWFQYGYVVWKSISRPITGKENMSMSSYRTPYFKSCAYSKNTHFQRNLIC